MSHDTQPITDTDVQAAAQLCAGRDAIQAEMAKRIVEALLSDDGRDVPV